MRGSPNTAPRWEPEPAPASDSSPELLDVPAAVVCATCSDPECPGCAFEEPTHASGVVAVVPWERPGLGPVQRLWSTARLSTRACDPFFGALPDGDVTTALRFALVAELLAVAGLLIAVTPLVLLLAPWLVGVLASDEGLREAVLRAMAFGVPGLSFAMVAIHAAHGIGLDLGARRLGSTARGRGLRFGLYACGWDLVTLPLGIALVAVSEGLGVGLRTVPLSVTVPGRAARAYLKGIHNLEEADAVAASRFGALVASALIVIGVVSILGGTWLGGGLR